MIVIVVVVVAATAAVFLFLLRTQNFIDGSLDCTSRTGNTTYNRGRTALGIPDDIDILDLGLLGLIISLRPTLLVHRYTIPSEFCGICVLTDCSDHGIGFNGENLVGCHRSSSTAGILLTQFHFSDGKNVVVKPFGIGKEDELDVLFFGKAVLFVVGRHLGLGSSINYRNLLNSWNTKGCTGAVHGGIAATYNHYIFAQTQGGGILTERREERE